MVPLDTKEKVKNPVILLVVAGMLFPYVIHSFDNLLDGLVRMTFSLYPVKLLGVISISYRGIIFLGLLYILFRIISSRKKEGMSSGTILSLKTFRMIGLISLMIIVFSTVVQLYVNENYAEAIELSKVRYIEAGEIVNLALVRSIIILLTNVTLLMIYLVIVFQKRVSETS